MKNILSIASFVLLATASAFAQPANCTAPITDNAHVLSALDVASLSSTISGLARDGVDVHVITDETSSDINQYAPTMFRTCSSWRNKAGGVKNNLVVLVNYPKQHKLVLVSGSQYDIVLNQGVRNDIKNNFIIPQLKSGQFGAGYVAGLQQVKLHLLSHTVAAASGSGVPIVLDQSTHAATDYSGFFKVLGWFVFIIFLGLFAFFVVKYLNIRKIRKLAQLNAISARDNATNLISRISSTLAEKTALGVKVTAAQCNLDNITSEFSTLGQHLQSDPTDDNLSTEAYESIRQAYSDILEELRGISTEGDEVDIATNNAKVKAAKKAAKAMKNNHTKKYDGFRSNPTSEELQPHYSGSASTTTVIHEDHYHDNSNDLLTGVLVGEALSQSTYREPVYREEPIYRDPESSYSRESDNRDSFSSDSSSSYDSGSSDSFSSDSSSSYDSGSSDSFSSDSSSSYDSGGGSSDY